MLTTLYSALHFLVDGVCAAAMFGLYAHQPGGYLSILLYNFCAFALQMPFGAVLDILCGRGRQGASQSHRQADAQNMPASSQASHENDPEAGPQFLQKKAFAFALLGTVLTVAGVFTSPIILGIGNGLFHVGGGVGTIGEDRETGSAGRRLGVFVAPGAMGLYLGRLASESGAGGHYWLIGSFILMAALMVWLWIHLCAREESAPQSSAKAAARDDSVPAARHAAGVAPSTQRAEAGDPVPSKAPAAPLGKADLAILLGCFLVVILRSFVGMQVGFPWKTTAFAGVLATAAVVLGKMAGGFLAASFGRMKTVVATLLIAAVCYAFSEAPIPGLLALLFFNMTMPITLQILVDRYKALPGTMFGLLTVALFVGFLPTYFSWALPLPGKLLGLIGSLLSLAILAGVCGFGEKDQGV